MILYHKILNFTDLCYKEEITPQEGKFCTNKETLRNICDGSKTDCVSKGKEKCHSDPNCHGVMYVGPVSAWWAQDFKGVKVCKTKTLVAKPEKDWSVYLKCDEGKFLILTNVTLILISKLNH